MENKDYIQLFERFIRSQVSEEEKELLKAWFGQDTSKEVIYTYYMQQWSEASDQLSAEIQYRMLENIKSKMKEAQAGVFVGEDSVASFPVFMKKFMRVAVAACLIGLVSISTYYFTRSSLLSDNKEFVVAVARGQKASVSLPDGTRVWLNSDSKLSYNNAYNINLRKVDLLGEAYFEVAKDKTKPFIVSTKGIDVEALGTAFSVTSYLEDSLTTATLVEGKVSVGNKSSQTILFPNESVTYNSLRGLFGKKHAVNADYIALWRNNRITFNGESLGEIATTLERMYNVDILFGSEKVRNYRFTGVIRNNSLSNVFEVISLTAPIQYKITNNTVEIQERKYKQQ
jgi:transmembrane sensor